MKSKTRVIEWYSIRAHGDGMVDNAATNFDDLYPSDQDKIDLIRQRHNLQRSDAYLDGEHTDVVLEEKRRKAEDDNAFFVEFRTFGAIDPAFIQYADSFHTLEAVKHDDMWMFPASVVEAEEDCLARGNALTTKRPRRGSLVTVE